MTPTLLLGIIAATILAGAFGYLGFRKDYNATLRRRHTNKYRDRLRKLDNIILGLPANYFPKTLKALVYASIANSLEHMAQFSGERNHGEQEKRVKQQLQLLQQQTDPQEKVALELDSHSLREYKHMLKDLHALILDFHKEGMLSQKEAEVHLKLVNNLMIGVTLDFYCEEGLLPNFSVVAEWEALNKEEEEWRKNYY